ncbi:hypothetical protein, partial [Janthinobacterium sp. LB3P118]|uniref:hypothetical protein n=1 Tax=Janthinobacterium sp. LB3P118 TaxID=3424195 RepID=UPI003F22ECBA
MSVTQNYKTVTFSIEQVFAIIFALEARQQELAMRSACVAHWKSDIAREAHAEHVEATRSTLELMK